MTVDEQRIGSDTNVLLLRVCAKILTWTSPITQIGGLFLLAYYLLKFGYEHLAGIVGLSTFALIDLGASMLLVLRDNLAKCAARRSAHLDTRGYFLLLRSFHKKRHQVDRVHIRYVPHFPFFYNRRIASSTLWALDQTINKIGPLVLIGNLRWAEGQLSSSLVVRSNERNWKTLYELLARHCRAIILIPEESPGLFDEIESILRNGHLSKTIILSPVPVFGRVEDQTDKVARWHEIAGSVKRFGIDLPEYQGQWFLYLPGVDPPLKIDPLTDQNSWEATFSRALEFIPPTGRPLRDVMESLECMEAGAPR